MGSNLTAVRDFVGTFLNEPDDTRDILHITEFLSGYKPEEEDIKRDMVLGKDLIVFSSSLGYDMEIISMQEKQKFISKSSDSPKDFRLVATLDGEAIKTLIDSYKYFYI